MADNENDARYSLYVETTIPSYAAAHDSRDIAKRIRQALTRVFWRDERRNYRLCTSAAVMSECSNGDPDAVVRRKSFMDGIFVLPITDVDTSFAYEYQQILRIPERAKLDCVHLAMCVTNKIDYLLTWNCAHLGPITYALARTYNDKHGLWTPHMVTPETIIEVITKEEWLKLQDNLMP